MTIDAEDPVSEESIRSDDFMANGDLDNALPVPQWTVQKGASKHGKDMLVESQGYPYTIGGKWWPYIIWLHTNVVMLILRIIN